MIPAIEELKPMPQWIFWRSELRRNRAGEAKETKVPYNPHTGSFASTIDPDTWGTYEEAKHGYRQYGGSGLGFVFTPESGIVGVDLDECIVAGNLSDRARNIVRLLDSYTEYSPSGSGLHILLHGSLPAAIKRDSEGVEAYTEARYFTMTGQHLGGTPLTLNENQQGLDDLWQRFGNGKAPARREPMTGNQPPEVERIREALSHIPKHQDYIDWIRVLAAVHSVYPGITGIQLIEEWSPGYDGEVEKKFRSFERTSKDDVGIGTLFYMARQNGWQPAPQQPPKKQPRRSFADVTQTFRQRRAALAGA